MNKEGKDEQNGKRSDSKFSFKKKVRVSKTRNDAEEALSVEQPWKSKGSRSAKKEKLIIATSRTRILLPNMMHLQHISKSKKSERLFNYPSNSSFASISNASLRDHEEYDNMEEERSLSSKFNMVVMYDMFKDYKFLLPDETTVLLPETLDICRILFEHVTNNDNEYGEKVCDLIIVVDEMYPRRFVEYAHQNNPNSAFITGATSKAHDHLVRQLKKTLEFHRVLILAYINDKKEADKLLNLLCLSHYLMKIEVHDYDILAIACIKTFLHDNLVNEQTLIHLIGYLCTVTDHIRKRVNQFHKNREAFASLGANNAMILHSRSETDHKSSDDILARIQANGGTVNLWARSNYRAMKDWLKVQEMIRTNVFSRNPNALDTKHFMELTNLQIVTITSSKVLKNLQQDKRESDGEVQLYQPADNCFLTWLKRGYKFRNTDLTFDQNKHFETEQTD